MGSTVGPVPHRRSRSGRNKAIGGAVNRADATCSSTLRQPHAFAEAFAAHR
ncbi:hypothetical protein [Streptomyces sp. ODS05-4]|uniref:hypothetical protein n=1 Tax=Streptomyces sp. ODS05-4 TaxID=2944939 RepID=UPI00210BCBAA|nr:hypothetical protein [Streptomyces sp. ODS05-4]